MKKKLESDRGFISLYMLLVVVIAYACIGLVVDGAGYMNARTKARYAAEAGVAAVLHNPAVSSGGSGLGWAAADAGYKAMDQYDPKSSAIVFNGGGMVSSEVIIEYKPKMLFGLGGKDVHGVANGRLEQG